MSARYRQYRHHNAEPIPPVYTDDEAERHIVRPCGETQDDETEETPMTQPGDD